MNPTAQILIRDVFPDTHYQAISEHFKQFTLAERAAGREELVAALAGLKVFYLLCFTNRCGSNHLGDCLGSDGRLRPPQESLNHTTVVSQSVQHGFTSFEQYLAWQVRSRQGPLNIYGVKATAAQLLGLYNSGVLHLIGPKLRIVHAFRREVLKQAVSFLIASRTQRWTSAQAGSAAVVDYADREIIGIADGISRQNALFSMLFGLIQLDAVRVPYDKLVEEPEKMVRKVGRHLGVSNLRLVPEKLKLQKQANADNEALLQRLTQDYGLGLSADTASTASVDL